jgi:hypothetical protein
VIVGKLLFFYQIRSFSLETFSSKFFFLLDSGKVHVVVILDNRFSFGSRDRRSTRERESFSSLSLGFTKQARYGESNFELELVALTDEPPRE